MDGNATPAENRQQGVAAPVDIPVVTLPCSPPLSQPLRSEAKARADFADARFVAALELMPLIASVREIAKAQADAIGRTERRFGSKPIMHLARMLDDLWMAADNFTSDVPELAQEAAE